MKIDVVRSHLFGLSSSNIYILEIGGETGLIDAGFRMGYKHLVRTLGIRRPKWVFLTHWHIDHVGLLSRIVEAYAPVVYCSARGADFITGQRKWYESHYYQHSRPWWMIPYWSAGFLSTPMPRLDHVDVIAPGDTVALGGEHWQVLDLKGHTFGSLGLYHAERRALFCGDASFRAPDGRLMRSAWPFAEDTQQLEATFLQMRDMGLRLVYPGHFSYGVVR